MTTNKERKGNQHGCPYNGVPTSGTDHLGEPTHQTTALLFQIKTYQCIYSILVSFYCLQNLISNPSPYLQSPE